MTLLEQLQSHRGGLIRLKTQLYWYDGVRNEIVGRICLLLDVADQAEFSAAAQDFAARNATATADGLAVALLLIEGQPQWIWLAEKDVEVIDESR